MTELEERIARKNPYTEELLWLVTHQAKLNAAMKESAWFEGAASVLKDKDIKRGLELLALEKAGKLCILDDDQTFPEVDYTLQDGGEDEKNWEWCQQDMRSHRWRRVKAFDDRVCDSCGEPSCPGNLVSTGPDPCNAEINDDNSDCDLCEVCHEDSAGSV